MCLEVAHAPPYSHFPQHDGIYATLNKTKPLWNIDEGAKIKHKLAENSKRV